MKIGVVGCGSLGGVIAGKLWAVHGDSVCVFVRNARTVAAVQRTGLRIDEGRRSFVAYPRVLNGLESLSEPLDLIVLATKATTLKQAADTYLPALSDSGCFMTVQNGLTALDLIDRYGESRVVAGCVMWGASLPEPGRFIVTARGPFVIGRLDGRANPSISLCQRALKTAFPVAVSDDIRDVLWAKLTITASLTSLGAITGLRFGEMLKRREIRRLILEIASEVVQVGRAAGVAFQHADGALNVNLLVGDGFPPLWFRHLLIRAIGLKHRRTESSAYASIQMGSPTEVEFVNGMVTKLGEKHRIQTPINAAAMQVIRELESGSLQPGPVSFKRLLSIAATY